MLTILAFGDSITYGSWDSLGGWVTRLRFEGFKREEEGKGFEVRIFNLGIPGETSSSLIKRISQEAEVRIKLGNKVIFLVMTGTNDVAYLNNESKFVNEVDSYGKNIEKIIEITRGEGKKLFFLNLPPVIESKCNGRLGKVTSRFNKDIQIYNLKLQEICSSQKIEVVDIHSKFLEKDLEMLFIEDGLHPNDKGHQLIFEEVGRVLNYGE